MEGALTELAEAASTKNPHMEFNLKKTAHKWNIPRKTLERYFHKPGYFDAVKSASGKGRGILTRDEEEEIVQLVLAQHAAGMALNHTQLKWVIMEVVRRVPGKANIATGKAWLNNNKPSYTWHRRFLERHSDRIRSRVVENLDPKRWKPLKDFWTKMLAVDGLVDPWDVYTEQDVIRLLSSTNESATQPLPIAIMTAFNRQELQLHAEIVEAECKQEALRRKLEQMRRKWGVLEAFSVDVATICHGFVNNNRPTKRTRRDGRGRTEALVLNTAEQVATAKAKLMLRDNKKSMKVEIKAAKQAARDATRSLIKKTSEVASAANASLRWAEKAHVHADAAANPSATKAVAESAARQAHAAVEKAVTWCQTADDELPACREALTAALHTKACVDKAEEQLRRLQAASLGMQVEEEEEEQDDEEDEEDEVQEEDEGGPPAARRRRGPQVDPAVAFEPAHAQDARVLSSFGSGVGRSVLEN
eukprot:jgi/Tetstr1/436534/TSEL_025359.t1